LALVVGEVVRFSEVSNVAVFDLHVELLQAVRPCHRIPAHFCVLYKPEVTMTKYYALALSLAYVAGAATSQISMMVFGI
jgi:hypothetical protein